MGTSKVISEIIQIQESVHRRLLDMRAFHRYLTLPVFEESYRHADKAAKEKLKAVISSADLPLLKDWTYENRPRILDNLTYRELRELAKRHSIPRWSRLDQQQLVEALRGIQLQPSQEST